MKPKSKLASAAYIYENGNAQTSKVGADTEGGVFSYTKVGAFLTPTTPALQRL